MWNRPWDEGTDGPDFDRQRKGGADPDGDAYTDFLVKLNTPPGFAGHTDWHLPELSELQSILVGAGVNANGNANPTGQSENCVAAPCIEPLFAAVGGPTSLSAYWTTSVDVTGRPWPANFEYGAASANHANWLHNKIRAVRAGSCVD